MANLGLPVAAPRAGRRAQPSCCAVDPDPPSPAPIHAPIRYIFQYARLRPRPLLRPPVQLLRFRDRRAARRAVTPVRGDGAAGVADLAGASGVGGVGGG